MLSSPYPSPSIHSVTVTYSTNRPTKRRRVSDVILMREMSSQDFLVVDGLPDKSPFKGTKIAKGQLVLAINRTPINTLLEATSLISERTPQLNLLTCDQILAPYCKMVVAPYLTRNPGVNFDSCRGRTMVHISKVFPNGGFVQKNIQKGDIVLAVNGIPVSKPESADMALRYYPRDALTILYVLDIDKLRMKVCKETRSLFGIFQNVSVHRINGKSDYNLCMDEEILTRVKYDPETLHLTDPEPYVNMAARQQQISAMHEALTKNSSLTQSTLNDPLLHMETMQGRYGGGTASAPWDVTAFGESFDDPWTALLHPSDSKLSSCDSYGSPLAPVDITTYNGSSHNGSSAPLFGAECKLVYTGNYGKIGLRFIRRYNDILDEFVSTLEEEICAAAFRHPPMHIPTTDQYVSPIATIRKYKTGRPFGQQQEEKKEDEIHPSKRLRF